MTFAFKLVACDVDGTIADPQTGIIPYNVRSMIAHVAAQGVPVVMTTGRAWVSTMEAVSQLGWKIPSGVPPTVSSQNSSSAERASMVDSSESQGSSSPRLPTTSSAQENHVDVTPARPTSFFVCSNGAVVVSYPPMNVIAFDTFDSAPYIEHLASIPNILLAAEDFGVGYRVTRLFPHGTIQGKQTVVTAQEMAATPVLKIIALKEGDTDADFHEAVSRLTLDPLVVFRGPGNWYDLCPPETSKAHGLEKVTNRLGIAPTDVLAFGDGHNDIDILRWAGRGVAIGDAADEVKQAADVIAPTFHGGGVLPELERWFGRPSSHSSDAALASAL